MRVGRESIGLDPTATTGQTIALQQADRKDEIKSAIEVIKSRSVVAQAVDMVGPEVVLHGEAGDEKEPKPLVQTLMTPVRQIMAWVKSIDPISDREEAIVRVERHMHVSAERESTVVVVQYDAKTPQLRRKCAPRSSTPIKTRTCASTAARNRGHSSPSNKIDCKNSSTNRSKAQRTAKNEMGLANIELRRKTLESQFSAVELDRLTTEQQLATSQARIEELKAQLDKVPERLVASKKSVPNQAPTHCASNSTHCR